LAFVLAKDDSVVDGTNALGSHHTQADADVKEDSASAVDLEAQRHPFRAKRRPVADDPVPPVHNPPLMQFFDREEALDNGLSRQTRRKMSFAASKRRSFIDQNIPAALVEESQVPVSSTAALVSGSTGAPASLPTASPTASPVPTASPTPETAVASTAPGVAEAASTGLSSGTGASDAVTNSVVPLKQLQQLQEQLSALEQEHAQRQQELEKELDAQKAATQALKAQEQQGTVGLTMTPTLINPEKHLPIDPNNAVLYNAIPTDPKWSIKPSDMQKSQELSGKADQSHTEFNVIIKAVCAEPTCSTG